MPEKKTFTHWECLTIGARQRFRKEEDGIIDINEDQLVVDRSLTPTQSATVKRSILRLRKSNQAKEPLRSEEDKLKAHGAKRHRRKVELKAQKKEKAAERAALKAAQKGKGKAGDEWEDVELSDELSELTPSDGE